MRGAGETTRAGLASALALLAATAAALAVSATAGAPADTPATVAGGSTLERAKARARELTPRVAARVERIRDLEFDHVPVPEVVTADRFAAISAEAVRAGPRLRRELADAEALARLLGLMRPGEQLDELLTGAPELAAAAYDPRRKRLYVVYDASGATRSCSSSCSRTSSRTRSRTSASGWPRSTPRPTTRPSRGLR